MNSFRRFAFALLLIVSTPALAVDGVIEINQACAVNDGCGSPDTAGFPVTTAEGKSYRLTSDLMLPDEDTNGVHVSQYSTFDLNGFAIRGPAVCTGSPATCEGTGSGNGIAVFTGSRVFNGTVQGMGNTGVGFATVDTKYVTIEEMRLIGNGGNGIHGACGRCRVLRSIVSGNGGLGIDLAYTVDGGSMIRENQISDNNQYGIRVVGHHLVLDNLAVGNGDVGLVVWAGLATFGNNAFFGNNGGTGNAQTQGGVEISTNLCDTNTTCP